MIAQTPLVSIRNVAIIAHVDHGKTTLVDGLLKASGQIKKTEEERILDNLELEKEKGITIKAKNASIYYKNHKINIIDTPGHSDFGGEVERVLGMADGSLLLVDAVEGPMPQTRFVLAKSLKLGHRPIVVINKIDREFANPTKVLNDIFDLFDELGATSEQLDFPVIYASAKLQYATKELKLFGIELQKELQKSNETPTLAPILDLIIEHFPNAYSEEKVKMPLQLQIRNLDYDDYVGRVGVGRIFQGKIKKGDIVDLVKNETNQIIRGKITKIFGFDGLTKIELNEAHTGDVVGIAGFEEVKIGDTLCEIDKIIPGPRIEIEEPTVSMFFLVNDSPFSGKEGRFVTTRQLRERLFKETLINFSIRVYEDEEKKDRFEVQGRGDLQLAILAETLRREGYELQLSKPEVILKTDPTTQKKLEPYEIVVIDVPEIYSGNIIQELNRRKGIMQSFETFSHGTCRIVYLAPTRSLFGFRSFVLTESKGTAAFTSRFSHYDTFLGSISNRINGTLVSMVDGIAVAYALWQLQERGRIFIEPGTAVYKGMIIGEHSREGDLDVNPTKEKKLTNVRASGSDEAIRLIPPIKMNLEQAIEFIEEDELVEVTPLNIRLRKKYLDPTERKKMSKLLVR
ncbi:MAG: translational GTPase TypA [Leptospiraceae bacterium]|nr:translational GTPase TypA [Leptospiraceae bacterium]MDW7975933.1 translational GTPase TypA [Leptospiraceae bacterium]